MKEGIKEIEQAEADGAYDLSRCHGIIEQRLVNIKYKNKRYTHVLPPPTDAFYLYFKVF